MSQPTEPDPVVGQQDAEQRPASANWRLWRPGPDPASAPGSGVVYQAPPPRPVPAPRGYSDVQRRFVDLASPYIWRLLPVAVLYSFVVTLVGENPGVQTGLMLGFWPLMVALGVLIHRRRQARSGPVPAPRPPVWDRYNPEAPPEPRA